MLLSLTHISLLLSLSLTHSQQLSLILSLFSLLSFSLSLSLSLFSLYLSIYLFLSQTRPLFWRDCAPPLVWLAGPLRKINKSTG